MLFTLGNGIVSGLFGRFAVIVADRIISYRIDVYIVDASDKHAGTADLYGVGAYNVAICRQRSAFFNIFYRRRLVVLLDTHSCHTVIVVNYYGFVFCAAGIFSDTAVYLKRVGNIFTAFFRIAEKTA